MVPQMVRPGREHTETSGVDSNKRPYPIDGTWERYTFKVGNIRLQHVPYRGGAPTVTALLAGEIPLAFETMLTLQDRLGGQ